MVAPSGLAPVEPDPDTQWPAISAGAARAWIAALGRVHRDMARSAAGAD
jgi:hypothetical protein